MDTWTKAFLIGLCLDRRKWAIESKIKTIDPQQAEQFLTELDKCNEALEVLIKL